MADRSKSCCFNFSWKKRVQAKRLRFPSNKTQTCSYNTLKDHNDDLIEWSSMLTMKRTFDYMTFGSKCNSGWIYRMEVWPSPIASPAGSECDDSCSVSVDEGVSSSGLLPSEMFPEFTKPIEPLPGKHSGVSPRKLSSEASCTRTDDEVRRAPEWGLLEWSEGCDDLKIEEAKAGDSNHDAQDSLSPFSIIRTDTLLWNDTPDFNHINKKQSSCENNSGGVTELKDPIPNLFEGVDVYAVFPPDTTTPTFATPVEDIASIYESGRPRRLLFDVENCESPKDRHRVDFQQRRRANQLVETTLSAGLELDEKDFLQNTESDNSSEASELFA